MMPHLVPSPWAAPYFIAALVAGAIAIAVLFDGRGQARRAFLGLLLGIGVVLITVGVVRLAADKLTALWSIRLAEAAAALVPAVGIEFASAITGRLAQSRPLRGLSWTVGLGVAALTIGTPWVVTGVRLSEFGFMGIPGQLFPTLLADMSLALAVPWLFFLARRNSRLRRQREQLLVLALSGMVAMLGFSDILPMLGIDLPPLGWFPLSLGALGLLYALARHRLLDVRLALSRAALWALLSLVGALPFVVLGVLVVDELRFVPWPELLLACLVLVGAMRLYLVTVQARLDTMVGRRRGKLDAELEDLVGQGSMLEDLPRLADAVEQFLGGLDRRLAALVIIDEDGPRVVRSAWGAVPAPSRTSPLLTELVHAPSLIWREHVRGPARVEVERALVRWGAEYLGALVDGENLLGIVAISPRRAGGVADDLELDALQRMCVVVTGALVGVRLYDRLNALSQELEEKAAARAAELARTMRELRAAQDRLVESEKLSSLGQIVAGVAGDLRTWVHRAATEAAQLRTDVPALFGAWPDAPAHIQNDLEPILDAVTEGARRAYAIAEDLSRLAPGAAPALPRQPVQLAVLADTTLSLMTRHLRDIAVVRDYADDLPPVPVENGPMGQVILNLLLNATQAMQAGGTLTLQTQRVGDTAELAVTDEGPGISPDALPHIFEPFFTTKAFGGTGLGLSVSWEIVRRHGGDLRVTSDGGGTTFRLRLPFKQ